MPEPLFIGLMSGTSMDGIDAVLADFSGGVCRLLATAQHPYPPALRARLLAAAAAPDAAGLPEFGALHVLVGREFAAAARAVLAGAGDLAAPVAAVGSHGQTLLHRPDGPAPFTLQAGDPATIAAGLGLTVVADFRGADLAAGGQGAPLVPAFHRWAFADAGEERVVVNLGGIANITRLPVTGAVTGFDTGPANTLLDAWCRRHLGEPCDRDGAWAAGGQVLPALLAQLLADPWFDRPAPKSTGVDYFNLGWLEARLPAPAPAAADVQATLAELTARSVAAAIAAHTRAGTVALCGGGTRNRDLVRRLQACLPQCVVTNTGRWGVDPAWVEAAAFAWLARERLAGRPGNEPGVTGARAAVPLGAVYAPPAG